MKKRIAALCLLVSGGLATGYLLAEQDSDKIIRTSLSKVVPATSIDDIGPSKLDGMSEVLIGMNVYYVTNDGKYILDGRLIDIETLTDLTEQRVSTVRKQTLGKVDEKSMIVFPAKEARHTVTVFTDIDCGYCRKLHNEIADYNRAGITVRYLSYPRGGPNSGSFNKAVSVWCADDRNNAMTLAKAGKDLPPKTCDNPVRDHFDLGMEMGLRGTPAIITEDGAMLPGYVPAKKLATELDGQRAG